MSCFGGATLCHWSGLRLQLASQPLEGDGASSCGWLSSRSGSSDRKLGNVCARGMKVIVRPLPVGKKSGESMEYFFLSVSLTGPYIKKKYVLFTWQYIHGTLLLGYCSCWYLYIQRKTTRIIPAFLKTSDVGGSRIIIQKYKPKLYNSNRYHGKSTFHLEQITKFQSDVHRLIVLDCLLSPLFPHSLPLHLNLN